MRIDKIINKNASSLILFFTGWSASPEAFRQLEVADGMDLWICYDYQDLAFSEDLAPYSHIHLVAWSLGVWVAHHLFMGKRAFETATAINGTPLPIDSQYGIPPVIFEGTLGHITEEGMSRFNRRMCGNRETLAAYSKTPLRPLDELEKELQFLHDQILSKENAMEGVNPSALWHQAIIGIDDKIFPTDNLRHYWQGKIPVKEIATPHFPFYHIQSWSELWK